MTLFFGLMIGAGAILCALSLAQARGRSDAWPPGWDHPGIGVALVVVGVIGEVCLWAVG